MSNRHTALKASPTARVNPGLTRPLYSAIEPQWASVNGAVQANVVVAATRHGEARPRSAAFEPVSV